MALLNAAMPLTQGYSAGASTSAQQSAGSGYSTSDSNEAREWAAEQARIAYERQKELMQMEMDFNREEARVAREWNESMANTVYTRSVNNMKEAGINPILAANMGLSAASVGSAQTASIGGHSAPQAQGFSGSSSAWESQSHGEGSSWNNSEQGIVTALKAMGDMIGGVLGGIQSGVTVNLAMNEIKNAEKQFNEWNDKYNTNEKNKLPEDKSNPIEWGKWLIGQLDPRGSTAGGMLRDTSRWVKQYKNGEKLTGWWEE